MSSEEDREGVASQKPLNAAANSSKVNPKGLASGFSNTEVIGSLNRGTVGRAVGEKPGREGSRDNKRREIADSEHSQLFREELQFRGVKLWSGGHEGWRSFYFICYLFYYFIFLNQFF